MRHAPLLGLLLGCIACACTARGQTNPPAPVVVNRTVPKVKPPTATLEFSAKPTAQEIQRARVFSQPLVPVGGEPADAENAALAAALLRYSKRSGVDDFSSLTAFLEQHPQSPWRASLLTGLGLDYYRTAYYSLALEAWSTAWLLAKDAATAGGKFLADRAVCELAGLYSRLGRMTELEALLKSVEGRVFLGGATERINIAREALSMMRHQPGISFRCGPMALHRIKLSVNPQGPGDLEIFNSVSTPQGFALPQVAELSKKVGLNYRMAFREKGGAFLVPSVVHWKVGHYAALLRQEGERYVVEDPTFGNTVWATKQALEAETSGYFLIPPGDLAPGWRSVDAKEGAVVRGKGVTSGSDSDRYTPEDGIAGQGGGGQGGGKCMGMAVTSAHLMLVNLQVRDTPLGYTPPVGPPVRFTVRYNHRDYLEPPNPVTNHNSLFGSKWTHDWNSAIEDDTFSPLADVKHIVGGGGGRTYTGFNTDTQTFAPQEYDPTLLKRTGPDSYDMVWPDGSKKVFGLRTSRNSVLLTQVVDPAGNAVTLTYDDAPRLIALTDAIGQVTTLSYGFPLNPLLITRITDPFERFASFDYRFFDIIVISRTNTNTLNVVLLTSITDVLGLVSRFEYTQSTDHLSRMITPYGTTTFSAGQGTGPNETTRYLETRYPDGSRDRVEYNQGVFLPGDGAGPVGMIVNGNLYARNTYYWSRTACATGYGDYSKAKVFHWLHSANPAITSGILESTREALEGRVWYDYAGQAAFFAGTNNRPTHVGRVLDDGSTQLYTYAYDGFAHVTNTVDPVGRTISLLYDSNGADLLEVRQTRAGNNELLARMTYNAQHRPLTTTDAAGQTRTNTYNARGQLLTSTNPKGETTTYAYDPDGYLVMVDGPLPGTNDAVTATYDFFGRTRTMTDENGYTLTFDYDVMDRLTKVTHPDGTFSEYTFNRLDLAVIRDRAGRRTLLEYDAMRQMTKRTDPLNRVTLFQWCSCGDLKSLTDPMGRTTTWDKDVQGRLTSKHYGDGSKVSYYYENTTSRLRQVFDEKQQVKQYAYNRDNTLKSIAYGNTAVLTPGVAYTYDTNYERVASMTDGTGTTLYSYTPITGTPTLGAGGLASVDGPLPNDTITYGYDELGRPVTTAINGVASTMSFDAAGRMVGASNSLGSFGYTYEGSSGRMLSRTSPNGQTAALSYGGNPQDRTLERITYQAGGAPISEFIYGHDIPAHRITSWSQQAGAQPPLVHTFGYDAANQLLSAAISESGALLNTFAYAYDGAGNRLAEQAGATNFTATYNALNQISMSTAPGATRTNEWDALDRLVAVTDGNRRIEFMYDGLSRRVGIRQRMNGAQVSYRRFVWRGGEICEERDAAGVVTKRFFPQGMRAEAGPTVGNYYYTRDHLGSIRELTDAGGNVRARYAYDPYGRRTRLTGDVEADLGFAGMFWAAEAGLSLTHFRAYDPALGRWLSRDPLKHAEVKQGPNLYAYVGNDPVNLIDPQGLGFDSATTTLAGICAADPNDCAAATEVMGAATLPQLAAEAGAIAEPLAAAGESLACGARTFAGIGSDTINVLRNTVPSLARVARPFMEKVLEARRWDVLDAIYESSPDTVFWMNFLDATRAWRIDILTSEESQEAMRLITLWTKSLF